MVRLTADVRKIDFSKELITWVKKSGYALLDVNVFPKPFATSKVTTSVLTCVRPLILLQLRHRSVKDDYSGDVMVYLWDNYISYAFNLVLL